MDEFCGRAKGSHIDHSYVLDCKNFPTGDGATSLNDHTYSSSINEASSHSEKNITFEESPNKCDENTDINSSIVYECDIPTKNDDLRNYLDLNIGTCNSHDLASCGQLPDILIECEDTSDPYPLEVASYVVLDYSAAGCEWDDDLNLRSHGRCKSRSSSACSTSTHSTDTISLPEGEYAEKYADFMSDFNPEDEEDCHDREINEVDKTVVSEVVVDEQAVLLNERENACDAVTNSVQECFDIGGNNESKEITVNDDIKLQRETLEISDRVSVDKVMIEDNCVLVRNKEVTDETLPGYISNENMAVDKAIAIRTENKVWTKSPSACGDGLSDSTVSADENSETTLSADSECESESVYPIIHGVVTKLLKDVELSERVETDNESLNHGSTGMKLCLDDTVSQVVLVNETLYIKYESIGSKSEIDDPAFNIKQSNEETIWTNEISKLPESQNEILSVNESSDTMSTVNESSNTMPTVKETSDTKVNEASDTTLAVNKASNSTSVSNEASDSMLAVNEASDKKLGVNEASDSTLVSNEASDSMLAVNEASDSTLGVNEASYTMLVLNEASVSTSESNEASVSTSESNEASVSTSVLNKESDSTLAVNEAIDSTLVLNEASDTTLAVNKASDKTLVLNGASDSMLAVNEASHKTLVLNEASDSTSVSNEASDTTSVLNEASDSTSVSNEASDSTLAVNEASHKTLVLNEASDSTSVSNEASDTTSVLNEASDSTSVSNEASDTTSVLNEASDSTLVSNEASDTTSVSNEASDSTLAVNEASDKKFAVNEASNTMLVLNEASVSTSVSNEASDTTSVLNEASDSTSVSNEASDTTSVLNEASDSTSVSNEASDTTSVLNEASDSTLVSNEACDTTSVSNEASDSTLAVNEASDKKFAVNEASNTMLVLNEASVSTSVSNEASDTTSVLNEASDSTSVSNEASDTTSVLNEASDSTLVSNEASDTTSVSNEASDSTLAVNEASDKKFAVNEASYTMLVLNEASVSTSVSNEASDTTSVLNEASDSTSVSNEASDTTSVLNEASDSTLVSNEASDTISVSNEASDTTSVLNEASDSTLVSNEASDTTSVSIEASDSTLAVNEASDKKLAVNEASNTMLVLNEASVSTSVLNEESDSTLAVNEANDTILVSNEASDTMLAVNETSDNTSAVNEARDSTLVVNETSDKKLAVNEACDSILAVNEASDSTLVLNKARDSTLAVNETYDSMLVLNEASDSKLAINKANDSTLVLNEASDSMLALNKASDSTLVSNEAGDSMMVLNEAIDSTLAVNEASDKKLAVNEASATMLVLNEASVSTSVLNGESDSTLVVNEASDKKLAVNEASDSTLVLNEASDTTLVLNEASDSTLVLIEASDSTLVLNEASDLILTVNEASDSASVLNEASDLILTVNEASDSTLVLIEASDSTLVLNEASDLILTVNEASDSASVLNEASDLILTVNETSYSASVLNEASDTMLAVNEASDKTLAVNEASDTTSVLNEASDSTLVVNEASDKKLAVNEASDSMLVLNEASDSTLVLNEASDTTLVLNEASDSASVLNEASDLILTVNEASDTKLIANETSNKVCTENDSDIENESADENNANNYSSESGFEETAGDSDSHECISCSIVFNDGEELMDHIKTVHLLMDTFDQTLPSQNLGTSSSDGNISSDHYTQQDQSESESTKKDTENCPQGDRKPAEGKTVNRQSSDSSSGALPDSDSELGRLQSEHLEKFFRHTKYPSLGHYKILAKKLYMPINGLRQWFQTRRTEKNAVDNLQKSSSHLISRKKGFRRGEQLAKKVKKNALKKKGKKLAKSTSHPALQSVMKSLKKFFCRIPYPSSQLLEVISKKLNAPVEDVKEWFAERQAKHRKETLKGRSKTSKNGSPSMNTSATGSVNNIKNSSKFTGLKSNDELICAENQLFKCKTMLKLTDIEKVGSMKIPLSKAQVNRLEIYYSDVPFPSIKEIEALGAEMRQGVEVIQLWFTQQQANACKDGYISSSTSSLPIKQQQGSVSSPNKRQQGKASAPIKRQQGIQSSPSKRQQGIASLPCKRQQGIASSPSKRQQGIASLPSKRHQGIASSPSKRQQGITSSPSKRQKGVVSSPNECQQGNASVPIKRQQGNNQKQGFVSLPNKLQQGYASEPIKSPQETTSSPNNQQQGTALNKSFSSSYGKVATENIINKTLSMEKFVCRSAKEKAVMATSTFYTNIRVNRNMSGFPQQPPSPANSESSKTSNTSSKKSPSPIKKTKANSQLPQHKFGLSSTSGFPFKLEQKLLNYFSCTPNPNSKQIEELAACMSLRSSIVKLWFVHKQESVRKLKSEGGKMSGVNITEETANRSLSSCDSNNVVAESASFEKLTSMLSRIYAYTQKPTKADMYKIAQRKNLKFEDVRDWFQLKQSQEQKSLSSIGKKDQYHTTKVPNKDSAVTHDSATEATSYKQPEVKDCCVDLHKLCVGLPSATDKLVGYYKRRNHPEEIEINMLAENIQVDPHLVTLWFRNQNRMQTHYTHLTIKQEVDDLSTELKSPDETPMKVKLGFNNMTKTFSGKCLDSKLRGKCCSKAAHSCVQSQGKQTNKRSPPSESSLFDNVPIETYTFKSSYNKEKAITSDTDRKEDSYKRRNIPQHQWNIPNVLNNSHVISCDAVTSTSTVTKEGTSGNVSDDECYIVPEPESPRVVSSTANDKQQFIDSPSQKVDIAGINLEQPVTAKQGMYQIMEIQSQSKDQSELLVRLKNVAAVQKEQNKPVSEQSQSTSSQAPSNQHSHTPETASITTTSTSVHQSHPSVSSAAQSQPSVTSADKCGQGESDQQTKQPVVVNQGGPGSSQGNRDQRRPSNTDSNTGMNMSEFQQSKLSQLFELNNNPSLQEIEIMVSLLDMELVTVIQWYKNARANLTQKNHPSVNVPVQTLHQRPVQPSIPPPTSADIPFPDVKSESIVISDDDDDDEKAPDLSGPYYDSQASRPSSQPLPQPSASPTTLSLKALTSAATMTLPCTRQPPNLTSTPIHPSANSSNIQSTAVPSNHPSAPRVASLQPSDSIPAEVVRLEANFYNQTVHGKDILLQQAASLERYRERYGLKNENRKGDNQPTAIVPNPIIIEPEEDYNDSTARSMSQNVEAHSENVSNVQSNLQNLEVGQLQRGNNMQLNIGSAPIEQLHQGNEHTTEKTPHSKDTAEKKKDENNTLPSGNELIISKENRLLQQLLFKECMRPKAQHSGRQEGNSSDRRGQENTTSNQHGQELSASKQSAIESTSSNQSDKQRSGSNLLWQKLLDSNRLRPELSGSKSGQKTSSQSLATQSSSSMQANTRPVQQQMPPNVTIQGRQVTSMQHLGNIAQQHGSNSGSHPVSSYVFSRGLFSNSGGVLSEGHNYSPSEIYGKPAAPKSNTVGNTIANRVLNTAVNTDVASGTDRGKVTVVNIDNAANIVISKKMKKRQKKDQTVNTNTNLSDINPGVIGNNLQQNSIGGNLQMQGCNRSLMQSGSARNNPPTAPVIQQCYSTNLTYEVVQKNSSQKSQNQQYSVYGIPNMRGLIGQKQSTHYSLSNKDLVQQQGPSYVSHFSPAPPTKKQRIGLSNKSSNNPSSTISHQKHVTDNSNANNNAYGTAQIHNSSQQTQNLNKNNMYLLNTERSAAYNTLENNLLLYQQLQSSRQQNVNQGNRTKNKEANQKHSSISNDNIITDNIQQSRKQQFHDTVLAQNLIPTADRVPTQIIVPTQNMLPTRNIVPSQSTVSSQNIVPSQNLSSSLSSITSEKKVVLQSLSELDDSISNFNFSLKVIDNRVSQNQKDFNISGAIPSTTTSTSDLAGRSSGVVTSLSNPVQPTREQEQGMEWMDCEFID